MLNRTKIIKNLLKEGFKHKTLSLLNDKQLRVLYKTLIKEASITYDLSQPGDVEKLDSDLQVKGVEIDIVDDKVSMNIEEEDDDIESEEIDIETDDTGNPDVDIDGKPLLREKGLKEIDLDDRHPYSKGQGKGKSKSDGSTFEPPGDDFTKPLKKHRLSRGREFVPEPLDEEFKSQKQQGLFFAKCNDEKLSEKEREKWCKMAKEFSEDTNYDELPADSPVDMVENWVMSIVEKNIIPEITKKKLLKILREQNNVNEPDFTSVEQETAFAQISAVANSAGLEVIVDEVEKGEDPEEDILYGYVKSEDGTVIDLRINSAGDIELDGAPIDDIQDFEEEVREKEIDEQAPSPLKTPVRTPTTTPLKRPSRPGPFKRPQTTPKPKAGKKEDFPHWFDFDSINIHKETVA